MIRNLRSAYNESNPEWAETKALLKEIALTFRQRGSAPLFLQMEYLIKPYSPDDSFFQLLDTVGGVAGDSGFETLPLYQWIDGKNRGRFRVNYIDLHPNRLGNERASMLIAAYLEKTGRLSK